MKLFTKTLQSDFNLIDWLQSLQQQQYRYNLHHLFARFLSHFSIKIYDKLFWSGLPPLNKAYKHTNDTVEIGKNNNNKIEVKITNKLDALMSWWIFKFREYLYVNNYEFVFDFQYNLWWQWFIVCNKFFCCTYECRYEPSV